MVAPGDVLLLGEGYIVATDAEVLEVSALLIDESMLTGESVPVDKKARSLLGAGDCCGARTRCLRRPSPWTGPGGDAFRWGGGRGGGGFEVGLSSHAASVGARNMVNMDRWKAPGGRFSLACGHRVVRRGRR
ncbi:hypothetical protein ACH4CE_36290 [Streptomyces gelaticus]|uniref:P-type ATPase n=1 Tax=Streptomyces gelaticus TaxID=285446 RepID=UPI00379D095D